MTAEDINRVHDRIDSEMAETRTALSTMANDMKDMAVALAKATTVLERMESEQKRQSEDRQKTCPNNDDICTALAVGSAIGGKEDPVAGAIQMAHRVHLMWVGGKWFFGIVVTCAVIPSGVWFFGWLVHVIARAVS